MEQVPGQPMLEKKSTVSYEAEFSPRISRLFIFRGLNMLVEIWVLYGWMAWIVLLNAFAFLFMLFTGERHEGVWRRQLRFMRHFVKWQAYLTFLVDQRPQWIED